ncbi:MAG: FG-GAP-like repeat-containing protein, partial [Methylococcales bacterium]
GTVVLYHILRDGSEIDTSTVASYTDNTVAADTAYVYNVTAEDNAGNESAISADLNVDTSIPSGSELIAYYPFEEGSGLTILDLSGNGNDGTLQGNATRTSLGNPGEAIEFNGSNSYINLGPIDITSPGMSIELWFKADDFDTGDARLISKATGISPNDHYWMISTVSSSGQHKLRFRLKTNNGGTSTLIGSSSLTAGVWTNVKVTYDGVAMKLFQDGIEVGSLAKTGTIATSTSVEAWIGANPGNVRYFDGLIDDVRISSIPTDPGTPSEPDISGGNRVKWSKLSSDNGDILPPGTHPQQTAALIFDINKDGVNDFVIGSRTGSGPSVVWYQRTTTDWVQHIIESDASLPLEAGGTFYDIDNDGDNDLVLGDGGAGQNIYWWENPFPNYGSDWTRRLIKTGGGFQHHDHIFGDFDNDGDDEFVYWVNKELKLYLAEIPTDPTSTEPWPATVIASFSGSARPEGIDKADIDLDGTIDIVGAGHWFKLQSNGTFQTMVIDSSKRFTRTAVGQLIEGGRPEVIIDSGDVVGNLTLYEWDGTNWLPTDLLGEQSRFGHSLNIGDVDGDGHLDIFGAEMTIQSNTNSQMRILYGDGAGGFTLSELDVGFEDHETKLGDLDGDGDLDILRKPFKNFKNGTPAIDIWINEGPNPFAFWNRTVADSSVPWRTIFLEYGDIDRDGLTDLITGGWWWKNPGSLSGNWSRQTIGSPMNQMATVYDFDADGDLDVIGTAAMGSQANSNLHWAENDGAGNFTIHSNVGAATGTFLQGVTVAEFMPGQLQIALSWQNGNGGLQLVNVPPSSTITTDQWAVDVINGVISEGEGLDHGDIDNDGDLDILTGINWLRNDGSGNWTQISMFNPTEGQSDRNLLVDMDGDNDLDAVIGYGHDPVGKLRWYEQPDNNPEQLWVEHFVANLAPSTAQSVDVADFDGDGDLDLSVGEHKNPDPGGLKLLLFENAGNDSWIRHEVYTGDEHHDAAHLVDLDTDGDLDIISIGWKHRRLLVYENQVP